MGQVQNSLWGNLICNIRRMLTDAVFESVSGRVMKQRGCFHGYTIHRGYATCNAWEWRVLKIEVVRIRPYPFVAIQRIDEIDFFAGQFEVEDIDVFRQTVSVR